jgi:hypothetical protein
MLVVASEIPHVMVGCSQATISILQGSAVSMRLHCTGQTSNNSLPA